MYHLPDQSEKSREPENENGDPCRLTAGRSALWLPVVCTWPEVSFWPRGHTRRGGVDSHQGQILHGAVCAGPRVHVWQVRGGDQPAVLAAGAGLHHGAGGHGGDAADLAPRLQVPHFRQGRRLLTTSDCWASPRCEASTFSSEKWISMFSKLQEIAMQWWIFESSWDCV